MISIHSALLKESEKEEFTLASDSAVFTFNPNAVTTAGIEFSARPGILATLGKARLTHTSQSFMNGCPTFPPRLCCAVLLTQHDTQVPLCPTGPWPGLLGLRSEITQPWKSQGNKKPLFIHDFEQKGSGRPPCGGRNPRWAPGQLFRLPAPQVGEAVAPILAQWVNPEETRPVSFSGNVRRSLDTQRTEPIFSF